MDYPVVTSGSRLPTHKITLYESGDRFMIRAPQAAKRELGICTGVLIAAGQPECPKSPVACYELFRSFVVENPSAEFLRLADHGRTVLQRIPATHDDGMVPGHLGAVTAPWAHQRRARLWLEKMLRLEGSGAFLYMGMGTGKTRTCLDLIRVKGWQRILVVAPKSALPVWQKQADLHYPGIFRVVVLDTGTVADRAERMVKALMFANPTVIVVNYDAVWRPEFATRIKRLGFHVCIADECHRLKGRGTQVAKFFQRAFRFIPHRIAMTGSPLSNGALTDFFGQAAYIDPGVYGLRITHFESQYVWRHPENRFIVQWRNVEHFMERFWSITHHQDRNVLDLPELVIEEKTYTLKGAALQAYVGMRDEFVAELRTGIVTAANAAVKVGKLQQITSGRVLNEDRTALIVHDEKQKLLEDVLRETGSEPVVVFANFTNDLAQVRETCVKLDIQYKELSGKHNELAEWQNGEGTVLGVQIRAGSESIDLVRSSIVVFFSQTYSLKDHEQSIARLHRPGQRKNVLAVFLIAENSIDRQIQKAIATKQDLVQVILTGKEVM